MKSKLINTPQFIFALQYAALFSGMGIVLPYFPRWLEGQGMTSQQVGLILAAALVGKVIIGPFFSAIADISGLRKKWLIILSGGYFLSVMGLHAATGFWMILAIWSLGGSLSTTQIPLTDSISVLAVKQSGLIYGNARLWGSISFIMVSVSAGWYMDGKAIDTIIVLLSILTGLAFCVTCLLPNLRAISNSKTKVVLWQAYKLPDFKVVLITVALLQASHAALYGFASIHWKAAGLSEFQIGILWAEGVCFEVLIFAFGNRLLNYLDVSGLLLLAVLGGLIRWTVMGTTTDFDYLLVMQLLHALTFATTHLAMVSYITRRVPDHLNASAQGLYDTLAMGILFAFAMWLTGFTFAAFSGKAFWLMAGFSGLSGVLLVMNWGRFRTAGSSSVETQ